MRKFLIFFLFLTIFTVAHSASAVNEEYSITLDHKTIQKGYTVSAFENNIKLSLVPGILSSSTPVEVVRLDKKIESPWKLNRVSSVYQFEFKNKAAYDNHTPFYIQLSYDKQTNNYKKIYFFDKGKNLWRPLPTTDFPEENFVRSLIHLPFARIAVFSYPEVLTVGKASWYAHKGGDFAASPDFPKGSVVRVHNTGNGKFVDVTINDYGPDRSIFPDRPIDLDKVAFSKISPTSAGIINVKLEPLSIVVKDDKVLNVNSIGEGVIPQVGSESVIIYNETKDRVIWSKNKDRKMRLASLTKLVSMKVFLDTNPDLEREVEYKLEDEEKTFKHVDYPYEAVKLKIKNGTRVKINDLLHSSIIASSNNTVETLLRVSGLSRAKFIEKMNEEAKKWGASSTIFVEPTGLSIDNFTTAYDYALIMKGAMNNPIIQKISILPKYFVGGDVEKTVYNTNNMIRYGWVDGITVSKTGYLHEAGYCLTTRTVNNEGDEITLITLNSANKLRMFDEMRDLLKYARKDKVGEQDQQDTKVDQEDFDSEQKKRRVNPFGVSDEMMLR